MKVLRYRNLQPLEMVALKTQRTYDGFVEIELNILAALSAYPGEEKTTLEIKVQLSIESTLFEFVTSNAVGYGPFDVMLLFKLRRIWTYSRCDDPLARAHGCAGVDVGVRMSPRRHCTFAACSECQHRQS